MRLQAGQYYRRAGHPDSAMAAFRRATVLNPRFFQAYSEAAMLAIEARRYEEARMLFRQAGEALGLSPAPTLAFVDGVERPAARRAALRAVDGMVAARTFPGVICARFYVLLGEPGKALDLLERAVKERAPFTTYINRWPELDSLAGEPRFKAVLRRIGLPEAMRP
jgi:tetratricopeptide (TPR) repeat protein